MFSKFRSFLVVVLVLAPAIAVSSASATTVTITGGGSVTGTASTATQFAFNTARRTINCTTSTFTATVTPGTYRSVTLPFTISTDVAPAFSSCTITGGLRPTISCTFARRAVTGLTDGAGDKTPVSLSGFRCHVVLSATCSVDLVGSVSGTFSNRNSTFTVDLVGQTLTAVNSMCAALPNDTSVEWSSLGGGGPVVFNWVPRTAILSVP